MVALQSNLSASFLVFHFARPSDARADAADGRHSCGALPLRFLGDHFDRPRLDRRTGVGDG
jgi:hypothetical protein